MGLMQIIYSSQPFGYDDGMLRGILMQARRNNQRNGLTGALVCRRDIYLQMLEGPEANVHETLEQIKQDDRHLSVTLRFSEPVSARLFEGWSMLHDPAQSWLWDRAEIAGGVLDRVMADEIRAVFTRLSARSTSETS